MAKSIFYVLNLESRIWVDIYHLNMVIGMFGIKGLPLILCGFTNLFAKLLIFYLTLKLTFAIQIKLMNVGFIAMGISCSQESFHT